MPANSARKSSRRAQVDWAEENMVFLCGEDDFGIERRAKEVLNVWNAPGPDEVEFNVIDGRVSNASEARECLAQFVSEIQTLPFFTPAKVIYLKKSTFLGEDRTSSSKEITDFVASLPEELKRLEGPQIRVLWSSGKVDKRKSFYKQIGKVAHTEVIDGWSARSRNWQNEARAFISREFEIHQKSISPKSIDFLVEFGGANPRQLSQEIEKICLYAGDERDSVDIELIRKIAVRSKEAEAFMLAEALGNRDLKAALHLLDREIASMASDKSKSVIAILYSLISKARALLMADCLIRNRLVQKGLSYGSFKAAVESLPEKLLSPEARFNPQAMPAYGLFLAYQQSGNYTRPQLIDMLDALLSVNIKLVSASVDPVILLQGTLIKLINRS